MKSNLYGNVTVLPFLTKPQPNNPLAYPIVSPLDKRRSWVICDYLTTVAVSRLQLPGDPVVPRVKQDDFNKIMALVRDRLPRSDLV